MAEQLSEDELDLLVKILQIVEPVYSDENIDIYKYSATVRSVFSRWSENWQSSTGLMRTRFEEG